MRKLMICALAIIMATGCGRTASQAQSELVEFETDVLAIVTQTKERHELSIELATDPLQWAQGLMFRRSLAPDAGMLFLYKRPRRISMWMKNTFIPLDMLFIDQRGRITQIEERTVPHSLKSITSKKRVIAVLELVGGSADRLDIHPGDRVEHTAFEQP